MRIILLLLAICILVEAKKGNGKGKKPGKPGKPGKPEGGERDGVCIPGEKMMDICTANTNFAVKMKEAMSTCKGETPIDMKAKKPSKGKGKGKGKGGKQCPTA